MFVEQSLANIGLVANGGDYALWHYVIVGATREPEDNKCLALLSSVYKGKNHDGSKKLTRK